MQKVHLGDMMKLFNDYTVTPAHTQTAPLVQTFEIDMGLITEAGVRFLAGCNNLVNVKIFFQEHQIFPRNQETWAHGNDEWVRGKLEFPVTAAPLVIKVIAWSQYCAFNHTITVEIEILPFPAKPQWQELIDLMTRLAEVIGA